LLDGALWLSGSDGLRRARRGAGPTGAEPSPAFDDFGKLREANAPASNLVSALAHDGEGNLWIGSFRNGIDIFNPSGRKLSHLDAAREINALVFDQQNGAMLAATSEGVLRFDAARRVERLTTGEGLASDSVAHLALEQQSRTNQPVSHKATPARASQIYVATSRGLSFGARGRLRTLTTVQGLPGNSINTVLAAGDDSAYAGTLNGLAQIVAGKVVRVFNDTNSNLKHNWVTALCRTDSRLFIGTYGGGLFELMSSGELRSFATETGQAFVNPNAMWCDDERVYAGTLEGVRVFELRTQKWTRLNDELPAPVVLSIEGRDGVLYIGTTGGIARLERSFWRQPPEGE
jgi:ligand-binding sensor domain-containing protein